MSKVKGKLVPTFYTSRKIEREKLRTTLGSNKKFRSAWHDQQIRKYGVLGYRVLQLLNSTKWQARKLGFAMKIKYFVLGEV